MTVKNDAQDVQINQNTTDIANNKTEINNRVDSVVNDMNIKNEAQDVQINQNTTDITNNNIAINNRVDTVINDVNIKNEAQDIQISKNETNITVTNDRITEEVGRLDKVDQDLQQQITNNNSDITVNIDRIDQKNESQDIQINQNTTDISQNSQDIVNNNTTINNKVDTVVNEIKEKDDAQDNAIAKNDKDITDAKDEIGRLDKDKADIDYVDQENAKQNEIIKESVSETIKVENEKHSETIKESIKESITTNNTIYDQKFEVQAGIDATQDARIDRNSQAVDQLGYKVGELSKELSGGIAAASAIAFMPSPLPGKRMVSGGAATYNGESSVAIGFTATTDSGKYSYKLGATVSSSGQSVVGGGLGFSF